MEHYLQFPHEVSFQDPVAPALAVGLVHGQVADVTGLLLSVPLLVCGAAHAAADVDWRRVDEAAAAAARAGRGTGASVALFHHVWQSGEERLKGGKKN